ncbi:hypothetical protein T439DRAFT_379848 [Meredithblackwellia eburnea MCA 4105]
MATLNSLPKATSRLVFKSLAYNTPSSTLFPSSASTYNCQLFTLKASPPLKTSNASTPRTNKLSYISPHPPPSYDSLVANDDPDKLRRIAQLHKPYSLQLTMLVGKKKVHKLATVREHIKRRFREAVRLVVVRGATGEKVTGVNGTDTGEKELVLEKEGELWKHGPRRWLLPGYSYVVIIPNLEIYRHPLPLLVEEVRKALIHVKKDALKKAMESSLGKLDLREERQRQVSHSLEDLPSQGESETLR